MTCQNCNTENNMDAKFCVKCGKYLINENTSSEQLSVENNNSSVQLESQIQQNFTRLETDSTIQNSINNTQINDKNDIQTINSKPIVSNSISLNYFMYIISVLLRPFKRFKEEENKLCNTKIAIIFSSIIAVTMMLINLIKSIIYSIFVKSMDYSTFQYKTTIDFSRLKNLDYISLIVKNLLIYAGIIACIALVYYLVGLIFKKSVNYIKLLSISATSLLPYIVLGMIVSPILNKIWEPLSIVTAVVGFVYSILIFLNLVNDDLKFDNVDSKIYFHLICLSILMVSAYYLYINILTNIINNELNNALNLFN